MDARHKVEELIVWRDRLGLSNTEWARLTKRVRVPVHYTTIYRMERGEHNPQPRTLRRLEAGLAHAQSLDETEGGR